MKRDQTYPTTNHLAFAGRVCRSMKMAWTWMRGSAAICDADVSCATSHAVLTLIWICRKLSEAEAGQGLL